MSKKRDPDEPIRAAVKSFGKSVFEKLKGPGEAEDQLRAPTERLLGDIADALGLNAVLHGEVHLIDIRARPDYRVDIAGAPIGYVEIKSDITAIDPARFKGHNARQWEKLRLLPNVLYTNGTEWRLFRNGVQVGDAARLSHPVRTAGTALVPADHGFTRTVRDFLLWTPETPRTVEQLVHAIAGLCRLLRSEVTEAIRLENAHRRPQLLTLLARDWRNLLFPAASDDVFADHYAQTVTFALLLARVEGISFSSQDLAVIAKQLGKKHSVMGKALTVLTDDPDRSLGAVLDTLLSVIGAVDWDRLDEASSDVYPRLYSDFLSVYDPELREKTGAYYTPEPIVEFMTRATDELLQSRLKLEEGFASPEVVVIDPAMGTGTFLLNVIERAATSIDLREGPGAIGPSLREAVGKRLVGFEKQTGPYAIAEMRLHDILRRFHTEAPSAGLRIYMADTLDDPYLAQTQLGLTYEPLAQSRRAANRLKREEAVMVAIGNPPYDAVKKGEGKWVEQGHDGIVEGPPLDAFRIPGNGRYEYVLTNLHIYFWRWATWKVFDHHRDAPYGIVAFISPSAYIHGRGFAGMREYLRRTADEGWIVDLSPEGHQPDASTRVFRNVRQPLCIGIFLRSRQPNPKESAKIRYTALHGHRDVKSQSLGRLALDDHQWLVASDDFRAPFLPQERAQWQEYPMLGHLLPWSSRGVTTGRTWVHAPNPNTLAARWRIFLAADDEERRTLLKESRDCTLETEIESLPGVERRDNALIRENRPNPQPIRVGFRSFDPQWLIPDARLMAVPRRDLWRVRHDRQIYAYELHTKPPFAGPAITFSHHIPDLHFYRGNNGGRALPLYRNPSDGIPNMDPDLVDYLRQRLAGRVSAKDLLAYVACTAAHPNYTNRFHEELQTPGVRIPITADPTLWRRAVDLGLEVIWLHTFGETCADPRRGRPPRPPRLPAAERPRVTVCIPDSEEEMPESITHDATNSVLHVGSGQVSPVSARIWEYEVSGMRVLKKWFGYRKRNPAGKRTSPLDDVTITKWPPEYTTELLNLINVLGRLEKLEPAQATLLDEICRGHLITTTELANAIQWPPAAHWTKPPGPGGATLFDIPSSMEE